jgi:hypothetical protein
LVVLIAWTVKKYKKVGEGDQDAETAGIRTVTQPGNIEVITKSPTDETEAFLLPGEIPVKETARDSPDKDGAFCDLLYVVDLRSDPASLLCSN